METIQLKEGLYDIQRKVGDCHVSEYQYNKLNKAISECIVKIIKIIDHRPE